jgi:phenylacetic acid degradation operon negative regulatory protein
VFSASLGRSNRTALKHRERALQMLGFRELEQGLHVRPNNIEHDLDSVRQRLHKLGLEAEASVFVSSHWAQDEKLRALWNGHELNERYTQLQQQLEDWMRHAAELDAETAARESFLLGGNAIRHIVFDPLLPEPLVNVAARLQFVATVRKFDQIGHHIWQTLYATIR